MSLLNIAIATFALFIGSSVPKTTVAFSGQVSPSAQPFSWAGSSGDLSINIFLVQDRDSVYGRGSYTVAPSRKVGCGGETLSPKGLVTMRAKGNFESFAGKLLFDSGWVPPFSAKRTSATTMSGSIRSVDRGICRIPLHRVAAPRRRRPPAP